MNSSRCRLVFPVVDQTPVDARMIVETRGPSVSQREKSPKAVIFGQTRPGGGCPKHASMVHLYLDPLRDTLISHISFTMSLAALFCQGRPAIDDESFTRVLSQSSSPQLDEKSLDANDEDDMQQRLSDLRREISDAKVDW